MQREDTMNGFLSGFRRLMVNGGLSDEAFEKVNPIIKQTNYSTWKIIAPLGTIYSAAVFLSTFSFHSVSPNAAIAFITMLIFGVATGSFAFKLNVESRLLMPLIMTLNAAILLFSIIIGVINSPEYLAVTFMVMLVALPLITVERPYIMEIILSAACIIFAVTCVHSKTGDTLEIELYNLVCFWAIASFLNVRMTSYRIKSFLWQHTIVEDSNTDALTHVKNSAAYSRFKVELEKRIHNKTAEPFAIVLCDVNQLKNVNDSEGHEKGDRYLQKNCQKMCRIFAHSPVYRIGGDEFLIYLAGTDYENRSELLKKAESASFENPYGTLMYDRVNFAAGMAVYAIANDSSYVDVFKRADENMYEHKKHMRIAAAGKEDYSAAIHNAEAVGYTAALIKKKILIADDNETDRELLKALLGDRYDCVEAKSGREALAILRSRPDDISVVILDTSMLSLDGYEFLESARRDPILRTIPVIAVAQGDDNEAEEKSLSLGAKDFIAKPYKQKTLISRIKNVISFTESTATLSAIEYDELTGFYTRQAFMYYADIMLKNNPDVVYDLCLSDIDDFRSINEKYGEEVGDKIIKDTAEFLKPAAEAEGILFGRYGSDKFVSLTPHSGKMTEAAVGPMFDVLKEKFPFPGVRIEGKIAVYENIDHNIPVAVSCERTALALSTIKHQYGKFLVKYDESIEKKQKRKFLIEQNMQEAYDKEQFIVYYQPKHDAKSGALTGAEALIRWQHPEYGFMPPGEFIPQLEQNGFISWADYYVLRHVCRDIKAWIDAGLKPVPISVNSSRRDFEHQDYLEVIRRVLEEYGVDTELLHIEITETIFADNVRENKEIIESCRRCGIKIELDDFGTGYSSLNALSSLPIDVVKLDRSFMDQIADERKAKIFEACVSLAHTLGLKTIAEGVENKEQAEIVGELGCDAIQGYHYSRPIPENEFREYLSGSRK